MAYDNQGAAVGAAGHYASAITAAFVSAGIITTVEDALETFGEVLAASFEACETLKGEQPAPAPASRGGSSRGASRGSSGGSNPGDTDFRGGKYAGQTIAQVYALGEDGEGYLDWCVKNLKNDFMVKRIEQFLQEQAA